MSGIFYPPIVPQQPPSHTPEPSGSPALAPTKNADFQALIATHFFPVLVPQQPARWPTPPAGPITKTATDSATVTDSSVVTVVSSSVTIAPSTWMAEVDWADAGAFSYMTEVLVDAPKLYLRLGEASGTWAEDTAGNFFDTTYVNGPSLASPGAIAGDTNTAVKLSSALSQYLTLVDNYQHPVHVGIDWNLASAASVASWTSVAYGNGVFVAVGNITVNSVYSNHIMTSPDGVTGRIEPFR